MLIFPTITPIWLNTATEDISCLLISESASRTGESALTEITSDIPRPNWRN